MFPGGTDQAVRLWTIGKQVEGVESGGTKYILPPKAINKNSLKTVWKILEQGPKEEGMYPIRNKIYIIL